MEEKKKPHRFKPGHKKVGGRKKGSINKTTEVANIIIDQVLGAGAEGFQEIWDELKAREKADFIIKMLPFKKAMMSRIDGEGKALPEININFVAAAKETKQLDNTINIDHEEIDT